MNFRRWVVFFCCIILTLTACQSSEQPTGTPDTPEAKVSKVISETVSEVNPKKDNTITSTASELDDYLKEKGFQGAILVANEDGVIFKKGYGMANIEEGIPFEPWTTFRIASVSKAFTSLAILQLQEQGKLQVQAPVSKYLPEVKFSDKFTIHQLMTHTSGLQRDLPYRVSRGPDEVLWEELESNIYLTMEPGDTFSYSNVGYAILGQLIEKISGQTYEDYMQEHIFKPLDMKRTFSESYEHITVEEQAEGYLGSSNSPVSFEKLPSGPGGISSTVEDLYLWDQALYTNKLVSNETLETIFTNYTRSGEERYGYGWIIDNSLLGMYSHSGYLDGFYSYFLRDTRKRHTVIILSNQGEKFANLYTDTKAGQLINRMLTEESLNH